MVAAILAARASRSSRLGNCSSRSAGQGCHQRAGIGVRAARRRRTRRTGPVASSVRIRLRARRRVEQPVRQEALGRHVGPVVVQDDPGARVRRGQLGVGDELAPDLPRLEVRLPADAVHRQVQARLHGVADGRAVLLPGGPDEQQRLRPSPAPRRPGGTGAGSWPAAAGSRGRRTVGDCAATSARSRRTPRRTVPGSSDSTSSGWLITQSIHVALPRRGTVRRSPRRTTTTSSYSLASVVAPPRNTTLALSAGAGECVDEVGANQVSPHCSPAAPLGAATTTDHVIGLAVRRRNVVSPRPRDSTARSGVSRAGKPRPQEPCIVAYTSGSRTAAAPSSRGAVSRALHARWRRG